MDEAVEQAVEQPKKKRGTLKVDKGFKHYVTTNTHTYPFEIQIAGEIIQGQWVKETGFVEFVVPDHLVDGFEKHYHFVMGNLAAE
jgi:hypothetical protein